MAFPIDANRLATNGSTAADPAVVNLVSGITVGDLLVTFFAAENTLVSAGGMPSGWTTIFEDQFTTTNTTNPPISSLVCRLADGTEGASISFDIANSAKFTGISWRITGAEDPAVQLPQFSTMTEGQSATPDPGTGTPTGGAKDYLWLWLGTWEGEQTSPPTGNPTNFSNPVGADTGTGGAVAANHRIAGASRQFNAASLDPGSWTISVADAWFAWTVAVHPPAPLIPSIPNVIMAPYIAR